MHHYKVQTAKYLEFETPKSWHVAEMQGYGHNEKELTKQPRGKHEANACQTWNYSKYKEKERETHDINMNPMKRHTLYTWLLRGGATRGDLADRLLYYGLQNSINARSGHCEGERS